MRYETGRRRGQPASATDTLARGLGLFSIALGIAEVAAPKALARALGMRRQAGLIQAYGLREIATGIGILASKDPTPWIWGRVAGDALDLATLATVAEHPNRKKENVGLAMAAVAGVTALDVYCAKTLSAESARPLRPVRDYRRRTGLPRPPQAMRGAALDTFQTPPDLRADLPMPRL